MEENRVHLFYFSGTGNTKVLAELYRKAFSQHCQTSLIPIEHHLQHPHETHLSEPDLVGILYPVHSFGPPRIINSFINSLPVSRGTKVFLVRDGAGAFLNGGSTLTVRNRLGGRGYLVFHETYLLMPSNFVSRTPEAEQRRMYETVVREVDEKAEEILEGKVNLHETPDWLSPVSQLLSISEDWGSRLLGRFFKVSDACTRCRLCLHSCPVGNISMTGSGIQFGWNCMLCMRCIYRCPEGAIQPRFCGFIRQSEPWDGVRSFGEWYGNRKD